MSTQTKLINVRLGDITGRYSSYYNNNNDLNICDFNKQINKDENTIEGIFLLYFVLGVLFLVTYPFFGLLATIFFHNKLYIFLHNYVEKINFYPSYFNEFLLFCKLKPKNFLSRLDLILTSIILSLTTWFVFLLLFNSRFIQKYNWSALYYSLTEKGYQPKKFNSWITVKERGHINGSLIYNCQDGNHRHITLLLIHGPEKKVKVKLV